VFGDVPGVSVPLPDAGVQIEDGTGFRGKVGSRIASAASQRHTVVPLMVADDATRDDLALQLAQRPARQRHTGRTGTLTREALNLDDDAGGKRGCAPASRLFVQARQALVEDPLSPFADDLTLQTETRGDYIVAQAVNGQQDNLCPNNVPIPRRILGGPLLDCRAFFPTERNGKRASSRHAFLSAATKSVPSEAGRVQATYVIVIGKQST
jgi:hypothetical protein